MRVNILINWYLLKIAHMILAQHTQFVYTFVEQNVFKYSFFPWGRNWERNKLHLQLHNAKFFKKFRNTLVKFERPSRDLIYRIHHLLRMKLLTRWRLGLSHFNDHRFKHNFENCINPLYKCSLLVESTKHFFLYCHSTPYFFLNWFTTIRTTSWRRFFLILLYGKPIFDENDNYKILETLIISIVDSKRFIASLLSVITFCTVFLPYFVIILKNHIGLLLILIYFHFLFTFSLADNEYWQGVLVGTVWFCIFSFYIDYNMLCTVKLCQSFVKKTTLSSPFSGPFPCSAPTLQSGSSEMLLIPVSHTSFYSAVYAG